ncbi:P-loop NTPase fold protein [Neorhizobium sp. CSC1952]|uniref:P-loop NTPase fold protein n=1 Tax=Neorhizobium sp. CSC1952 TaxID=2978974 RepID=UPI0025A5DF80|nr:P-loop NTPase fold protein [Rhizobium sp. CSC1952]WJR66401.1 P-loop NTPase fold protein [Rhizobium sp. CSC1952]
MTAKEMRREILLDEPSNEDLFHGKGHERTADALVSAIKTFKDADRAIGLDGPWGSGKSSVVGIAERKLHQANGNGKVKFHFFTFDIWKSQGSAFRRSFLEHLVAWAHITFPKKSQKLREIESKIKGKIREVDSNNQLNLDIYGIVLLLAVPFLPIYVLWTKSVFDAFVSAKQEDQFLYSWPMFLIYAFLATTFLAAYAKYKRQSPSGKNRLGRFRLALSQTLLIGAKQYEHQKVTQYIRETDPNDFEFQSVLREILAAVQDDRSKVIIVLDNIDRLPPDEIGEYWALVRSIFSRTHSDSATERYSQIIAIVPYDRRHIDVAADKDKNTNNSLTLLRKRELFSKTFDEILNVAPPVMSNTREFFDQKIRVALPDFSDADALFRVYLIFNMLIDRGGGKATPRQVISYINEVSGLYSLHAGRVPLPTVGVYLALQDTLEDHPAALADYATIDEHLRSLAADKDLEKNLAAILFNVEPELAFQLLLDGEIETAANSDSSDQLLALSKSPGFGVRVNDVFVANASAWRSSAKFALAISNFSDLLQVYEGEGASHLRKSTVAAFQGISEIALGRDAGRVQKLLTVCAPSDRLIVLEHLFTTALNGLGADKLDQAKGKAFLKFLSEAAATVASVDPDIQITPSLKKVALPSSPTFLFGFATDAFSSSIKLNQVAKPVLDLSSDPTFLETIAIAQPIDCIPAFASFKSAAIINDEQWNAISTTVAKSLVTSDTELDQFHERLPVLSASRSYTSLPKLKEVDLADMFADATFYKNLHSAYSEDLTDAGIAHAIFLAGDLFVGGKLAQPMQTLPNNQRVVGAQEEFAWFYKLLTGELPLVKEQLDLLVDKLVMHYRIPRWSAYGITQPDNSLVSLVVSAAFSRETPPWIAATDLLKQYAYIKKVLGSEFQNALPKLGSKVRVDDLPKIAVADFPVGILIDTANFSSTEWKLLHERADVLLNEITTENWLDSFSSGEENLKLLLEKAKSSGYIPTSTGVRDALLQFILGTLDGSITQVPDSDYDTIMSVIDQGYHLEFYRMIREGIKSTTIETISEAIRLFPSILRNVIQKGEKSRQEKENLIRYVLRPALEGGLIPVTDAFLELKRSIVADFIRASDESVRTSMEPALRLFSTAQRGNYDYVRRVGELVQGKRAKSLFERLWTINDDVEDDDTAPVA